MKYIILLLTVIGFFSACSNAPDMSEKTKTYNVPSKTFQVTCPLNQMSVVTDTVKMSGFGKYDYTSASLIFIDNLSIVHQYPNTCVVKKIEQ